MARRSRSTFLLISCLSMVTVMPMCDRQKYLFDAPTSTQIAEAAKQAIRAVKADHPQVQDIHLAALIDADSAKTIERLEKMETKKVPASLFAAIGRVYGEQYISAYLALMGRSPKCEEAANLLPDLASLTAKVAAALNNGRSEIPHQALGGMLGELRAVDAAIASLRARASALGMAA